jgi:hypothetical protein
MELLLNNENALLNTTFAASLFLQYMTKKIIIAMMDGAVVVKALWQKSLQRN